MCWAHVNINLDKKVKSVNDAAFCKFIMQDICSIQLAENYEMFIKSFELFKTKTKKEIRVMDGEVINYRMHVLSLISALGDTASY